jgi:glycosyltransferase involved in cell wall biosynthesis
MKNPLVSFCVPTFNRAAHLRETLDSALNQTEKDFEIIVVDDASTDSTEKIVGEISDSRVRYIRNDRNIGVPRNYNYVFSLARGDYICLLEDHDLLEPNYLKELLPLFKVHPELAFAFCSIVTIDDNGNKKINFSHLFPEILSGKKALRNLLVRVTCPCSITTLIRRSFLSDFKEPFSSEFWWYADINLWMQLAAKGDIGYVKSPLLQMRIREQDHFLKGKEWKTFLAVDKIHQVNWKLLYPKKSIRETIDRKLYEAAKTWNIIRFKANKIYLRQMDWSDED